MSTLALYTKIELLPEDLKKQVIDYIEFLLSRESKAQQIQTPESPKAKVNLSIGGAAPPFICPKTAKSWLFERHLCYGA